MRIAMSLPLRMRQCMKQFSIWSVARKRHQKTNYARLKNRRETIESLYCQLTEKDQETNQLTKDWDSLVRGVRERSEQIHKIIQENLCQPKNNEKYKINSVLLELEKATSDLKQFALQSTDQMQTKGLENRANQSFDDEFISNIDE